MKVLAIIFILLGSGEVTEVRREFETMEACIEDVRGVTQTLSDDGFRVVGGCAYKPDPLAKRINDDGTRDR